MVLLCYVILNTPGISSIWTGYDLPTSEKSYAERLGLVTRDLNNIENVAFQNHSTYSPKMIKKAYYKMSLLVCVFIEIHLLYTYIAGGKMQSIN